MQYTCSFWREFPPGSVYWIVFSVHWLDLRCKNFKKKNKNLFCTCNKHQFGITTCSWKLFDFKGIVRHGADGEADEARVYETRVDFQR